MSGYKIVQYKRRSTEYDWAWETRFRIIDSETGKVVDDANGYGYKTFQSAQRVFFHRNYVYAS